MTKTIGTKKYGRVEITSTNETAGFCYENRWHERKIWADTEGRAWVKMRGAFKEIGRIGNRYRLLSFTGGYGYEVVA